MICPYIMSPRLYGIVSGWMLHDRQFKSNLPTAVQTLLGGSHYRGRIAAPTVPYDLPLVRLMYGTRTRGMKYRTGTSTYCLPACREAGRKAGIPNAYRTHTELITNAYRTHREHIPKASRPKMRAPVSTCSAVQYRTTYPHAAGRQAGRQASRKYTELIPNLYRKHTERIPNRK